MSPALLRELRVVGNAGRFMKRPLAMPGRQCQASGDQQGGQLQVATGSGGQLVGNLLSPCGCHGINFSGRNPSWICCLFQMMAVFKVQGRNFYGIQRDVEEQGSFSPWNL